jgi:hypothetical protein
MSLGQSILARKMILRHLIGAAICLAHVMFGLPPAINGHCGPVAAPDPIG